MGQQALQAGGVGVRHAAGSYAGAHAWLHQQGRRGNGTDTHQQSRRQAGLVDPALPLYSQQNPGKGQAGQIVALDRQVQAQFRRLPGCGLYHRRQYR